MWASQILLFITGTSIYVQVIPLGIMVDIRTAFPLYFSMLCFPLLLSNGQRLLSRVAIFIISLSFACPNINSLRYYHGVTSTYLGELTSITPHPERYKVIFLPDKKEVSAAESKLIFLHDYKNSTINRLTHPMFWAPVAYAAHFPAVLWGDAARRALAKLGPLTFTRGKLYDYALADGHLVLKFDPDFIR